MRIVGGIVAFLVAMAGAAAAVGPPGAALKKCPADAVVSGSTCMDKYEASVWRVPNAMTTNTGLVAKIQAGKAKTTDLTAGGATQLGIGFADDYGTCADSGQNCVDIFAVSLAGVLPSANVTWFQSQQACKNSRKRLPTNSEWQAAVAGTPDPGGDDGAADCNTESVGQAVNTGSRSRCKSSDGAFDMVGNVMEWVAEWAPASATCGTWSAGVSPTGDYQCLTGTAGVGEPGALLRGGFFNIGPLAGPLAVLGTDGPSNSGDGIGFRCAR